MLTCVTNLTVKHDPLSTRCNLDQTPRTDLRMGARAAGSHASKNTARTRERRSLVAYRLAPSRYSFMVKLTVHSTGAGTCLLTGKDSADGLVVSFEDGTVKESHLSWRAFRQLLGLKAGQNGTPGSRPIPASPAAGQPIVAAK